MARRFPVPVVAIAFAVLGLVFCEPVHAQTGAACLAGKLRAVGKKEAGLLTCEAKVAARGDASTLPGCEAKASAKFSSAMARYTGCSGTTPDCETAADTCEQDLRTALPDGTTPVTASPCEGARLKAAGKKAKGILKCYAKAALKGVAVDTAPGGCVDKVETKFATL